MSNGTAWSARPTHLQFLYYSYRSVNFTHSCSYGLNAKMGEYVNRIDNFWNLTRRDITASVAKFYPEYAPDYWATCFTDPEGTRLELTNYHLEHQERHDNW